MGSPEKILRVAERIAALHETGEQVLVVVSAMGQTTDELTVLAQGITATPPRREMDMLLTAGERISMALLAMALTTLDCPAISFTGSQSGIITDDEHADARIFSVRPFRIEDELGRGKVVIVAGFQGVSEKKEITTLGRGGSDTTAVAMAIRLGAARSEIHTDVPAVLSADPRVIPRARPLSSIAFDPMIVLSHLGGRVMYWRALRLARRFDHPVVVGSAHGESAGTLIGREPATETRPRTLEEIEPMESARLLALALESSVVWIRTEWPEGSIPQLPADWSRGPCLLHHQTQTRDGKIRAEWVLPDAGAGVDPPVFAGDAERGRPSLVEIDRDHALVSLVGDAANLGTDLSVEAAAVLNGNSLVYRSMQTGAHALSILVPTENAEEACRLLHAEFLEGVDG